MKIKIRKVKKSDFKTCAQIIFEEFNKQNEGFTRKTAYNRVKNSYHPKFCLCAIFDNAIIGLIMGVPLYYAKGKYIWIDELVVKEDFQRKGIGKQLMKELEKISKKNKVNVITLNTKKMNLSFYTKLEFNKTNYVMVEKEIQKMKK
jgi:predicted N-acetyltransferase YhbS